jgi:hypothetical protein
MASIDKPPEPAAAAVGEKRRHLRRKVLWAARVSATIGERPCTILNISRGGVQIKLDATLDPMSNVQVVIPSIGRLNGFVAWSNHDRAGIQFSEVPEALAATLERALSGERRQ